MCGSTGGLPFAMCAWACPVNARVDVLMVRRAGVAQDDLPPVEVLELEIGEQEVLLAAGKISSVLEAVIVVQARHRTEALERTMCHRNL